MTIEHAEFGGGPHRFHRYWEGHEMPAARYRAQSSHPSTGQQPDQDLATCRLLSGWWLSYGQAAALSCAPCAPCTLYPAAGTSRASTT